MSLCIYHFRYSNGYEELFKRIRATDEREATTEAFRSCPAGFRMETVGAPVPVQDESDPYEGMTYADTMLVMTICDLERLLGWLEGHNSYDQADAIRDTRWMIRRLNDLVGDLEHGRHLEQLLPVAFPLGVIGADRLSPQSGESR